MKLEDKLNFDILKYYPNRLNWNMNSICNFNCKYCFFSHVIKENPAVYTYSTDEVVEAFNITGKQWLLFLSGGEPFLYPNFIELINKLKQKHFIQISTNLMARNVKEFANSLSPQNIFLINASVHIINHTKESLNVFIENFLLLKSKGFDIIASYVTYPPLFKHNKILHDFEYLQKQGVYPIIPLTYNGIYKRKHYPGSYTNKQLKTIFSLASDKKEILNSLGLMNFKGYNCSAGFNYFYMNIYGDIYRCVSIHEYLGNLFEHTFKPLYSPKPCDSDYCNDSCHGIISVEKNHIIPDL
jgi:MoaA/NifB/PqqE/SkfB family radical SAM enzyme